LSFLLLPMSLRHMTLSRSRGQPVATSEGIYFRMVRGRQEIKCLVTRAALSELAGYRLEISQLEGVYYRHCLLLVEAAKREFIDAGRRNKVVAVGPEDVREARSSWAIYT
jgi:hypothetical protein